MDTIEQLHSDPRPLVSLSEVCAVTGKPIGELLIKLADQDTPLLLTRPEKIRIFCVVPSPTTPFHEEIYQEAIIELRGTKKTTAPLIQRRSEAYADASHFSYLVLTTSDYLTLTERGSSLSADLFNEVSYIDNPKKELITTSAYSYYRDHFDNAHIFRALKAKFICYTESKEWPSALKKISVNIRPEELLVSRRHLASYKNTDLKQSASFPPELQKHLQPWKSDFLIALNLAAHELYSKMSKNEARNSRIKPQDIQEAIKKKLSKNSQTISKISTAAPLLRHDENQKAAKEHLVKNNVDTRHYPHYFSQNLIYLNEKCREYHDEYLLEGSHKLKIEYIKNQMKKEKIIPNNTIPRIANSVRPNYEEIKRPVK